MGFLIICFHAVEDILAQAFLIEPWFGAVEVAHVEEAPDGLVFRSADGDGIVQGRVAGGRRGIPCLCLLDGIHSEVTGLSGGSTCRFFLSGFARNEVSMLQGVLDTFHLIGCKTR